MCITPWNNINKHANKICIHAVDEICPAMHACICRTGHTKDTLTRTGRDTVLSPNIVSIIKCTSVFWYVGFCNNYREVTIL